ncbi:MAG TPA: DegT/DnrJ/EryC1/StrS family aminotransferase [Solirubrobacterales bacterium]
MKPQNGEKIPLSRPELREREETLLLEAFRSGRLSLGPMLERFERQFALWLEVEDAVAVSSGTAALHLGVRGLGWGEGDEVLTSPFSFVASANCLLYERAHPVFCDVDPVTLNLDPAAAAAAVTEKTTGILPIHVLGWPAAMPQLEELAARQGLGILEDACEAIGAVDSEGRRVGTRGNAAAFAFYPNKQMTTGEGGMLIPPGPDQAARYRSERNQGRAEDMTVLEHERLGFNYRLSELACALGIGQIERIEELLLRRSYVAAAYEERLTALAADHGGGGEDGLLIPAAEHGSERRSWFVYVVQLPVSIDRETVISSLAEQGIPSKAYLPCLHLFPHLRELGYREGQFPIAERAGARSLGLPFFTSMREAQVDLVCEALAAALAQSIVRSSSTS